MFKHTGRSLQTYAKVLFWLVLIASIVLASVFGFKETVSRTRNGEKRTTEFYPIPFFSFLLGGPASASLLSLCLNGFGKIVERYETTETGYTELGKADRDALKSRASKWFDVESTPDEEEPEDVCMVCGKRMLISYLVKPENGEPVRMCAKCYRKHKGTA